MDVGKLPESLRPIQPFLTIYKQFIKRDRVVSYYALKHAVSEGLKVPGPREAAVKGYLTSLLDVLENIKKSLKGVEEVSEEVVGAARVEAAGMNLFQYADKEDRNGRYHKNMVKAYFTSFHMFGVVKGMEELNEEIEAKQKYAMWRAVEIDRCLKNDIQPTPPPGEMSPDPPDTKPAPKPHSFQSDTGVSPQPAGFGVNPQPAGFGVTPEPAGFGVTPEPAGFGVTPQPAGFGVNPQPAEFGVTPQPAGSEPSSSLSPEVINEAKKKCKFASSALDYDDVAGAIEYLTGALGLLQKKS